MENILDTEIIMKKKNKLKQLQDRIYINDEITRETRIKEEVRKRVTKIENYENEGKKKDKDTFLKKLHKAVDEKERNILIKGELNGRLAKQNSGIEAILERLE